METDGLAIKKTIFITAGMRGWKAIRKARVFGTGDMGTGCGSKIPCSYYGGGWCFHVDERNSHDCTYFGTTRRMG